MFLNGTLVSNVPFAWTPDRVGAYDVRLPKSLTKAGNNEMVFMTDAPGGVRGLSDGAGFFLWYIRIRPM